MCARSVDPQYFIDLYRRERDPWNFENSEYEREKYNRSIGVLRGSYACAIEIACSIGVFTKMLAARCGSLYAMDVSPDAVERARDRCKALANVQFAVGAVPRDFPSGRCFDLVTFCEVGFYLDRRDLLATRNAIVSSLNPGGQVLLVHWTPPVHGHATTAEEVHESFYASGLRLCAHHEAATYRLDLFESGQKSQG